MAVDIRWQDVIPVAPVVRSLVAGPVLPGGRVLGRGRHECGPGQRVDEGRRRLGRPYQRYIIVLPYG